MSLLNCNELETIPVGNVRLVSAEPSPEKAFAAAVPAKVAKSGFKTKASVVAPFTLPVDVLNIQ